MSNNFKKQVTQQRTAIPQIDPESAKPTITPVNTVRAKPVAPAAKEEGQSQPSPVPTKEPEAANSQVRLTQVDTSETPTNRGFSMYPSRHRQVAKDLAYLEDRNPWEIIEDALEEYVVKRYGKDYKRK
jgi:hypothetical protein